MAEVAAFAGLASTALSTYSQYQALQTKSDYAQQEATAIQGISEFEARQIEESAAFQERQSRRTSKLIKGEANAQVAAAGLDLSRGSTLFLELDRAKQAELEALEIRRVGAAEATGRRYGGKLAA